MDAHGDTSERPDRGLLGRWILAAITVMDAGSPTALAKKSKVSRPTVRKMVDGDPEGTTELVKWQAVAHKGFGFSPDTFQRVAVGDWQSLASRNVPTELVDVLRTMVTDKPPARNRRRA